MLSCSSQLTKIGDWVLDLFVSLAGYLCGATEVRKSLAGKNRNNTRICFRNLALIINILIIFISEAIIA